MHVAGMCVYDFIYTRCSVNVWFPGHR